MDKLERLKNAKYYIEKLANGTDPISDVDLPNDAILNDVRLSRCFFYVADVLRQVIENGGEVKKFQTQRMDFYITEEQKNSIAISASECFMKDLINNINEVTTQNNCKRFQQKWMYSWLIKRELMQEYKDKAGKSLRRVTSTGETIGLKTEFRNSMYGVYTATLLNQNAQRFFIDNIDAIIAEVNSYNKKQDALYQGMPWSTEHEAILIDLFNKSASAHEMAVTLKRTENGIRERLKKLGMIENRYNIK